MVWTFGWLQADALSYDDNADVLKASSKCLATNYKPWGTAAQALLIRGQGRVHTAGCIY